MTMFIHHIKGLSR